ncbi:hypothetical protein HK102_004263 [Quaeritorhiza haematococci]|nr:hypothetical protein HK102_004263 [Quaeritorhiza haematococci]
MSSTIMQSAAAPAAVSTSTTVVPLTAQELERSHLELQLYKGSLEVMLSRGLSVNWTDSVTGETLLHILASRAHLYVAKANALGRKGAGDAEDLGGLGEDSDEDEDSWEGQTVVVINGRKETEQDYIACVKLLLSKGADPRRKNRNGETSLNIAINALHDRLCAVLVEKGAPCLQPDPHGWLPIQLAAMNDLYLLTASIVKRVTRLALPKQQHMLLEAPNKSGYTPLHLAASHGHHRVVFILAKAGAQVDAVCENGTPLHMAARHGFANVVRVLIGAGADPNVRYGVVEVTPLELAQIFFRKECAKVLEAAGGTSRYEVAPGVFQVREPRPQWQRSVRQTEQEVN